MTRSSASVMSGRRASHHAAANPALPTSTPATSRTRGARSGTGQPVGPTVGALPRRVIETVAVDEPYDPRHGVGALGDGLEQLVDGRLLRLQRDRHATPAVPQPHRGRLRARP